MRRIGEYFDISECVVSRYIKDVAVSSGGSSITEEDKMIYTGKILLSKEIEQNNTNQ